MQRLQLFFKHYPAIFFLLVSAIFITAFSQFGILPAQDTIVANLTYLHETYGLQALFISSLIEGFLFFGLYYIGSAFIVAAVVLADGDPIALMKIIITVWSALTIMSVVNFTLAKYHICTMYMPDILANRWVKKIKFILFLHPTLIAYQAYVRGQSGRSHWSLVPLSGGIFLAGFFYATIITVVAELIKMLY